MGAADGSFRQHGPARAVRLPDKECLVMRSSARKWILTGATLGLLAGAPLALPRVASAQQPAAATAAAPAALPAGGVSEEQLGQLVAALGIKPEKQQQRYDFAFRANLDEQEWTLSMSTVLSTDQQSIWIMAWLDELPKNATDVPRNALLRMLATNDAMGNGKFFAYIPNNRRFVLQRSIPNEGMTQAKFRQLLQDLGGTVVETYPVWSVSSWNATGAAGASVAQPSNPATATQPGGVTRSAANDPKNTGPVQR